MATLKPFFAGIAALGLLAGGATLVVNAFATPTAQAQTYNPKAIVDAAIVKGDIGEQIDGYLGIVDGKNPSADVRAAMDEVNNGRKVIYNERAENDPQPAPVWAKLTGEKQIAKAKPGTYIKDASGTWRKK